ADGDAEALVPRPRIGAAVGVDRSGERERRACPAAGHAEANGHRVGVAHVRARLVVAVSGAVLRVDVHGQVFDFGHADAATHAPGETGRGAALEAAAVPTEAGGGGERAGAELGARDARDAACRIQGAFGLDGEPVDGGRGGSDRFHHRLFDGGGGAFLGLFGAG